MCLGLIPLTIIGFWLFRKNMDAVTEAAIANAFQTAEGTGNDVEALVEDITEYSKLLYEYQSGDYGYFYDVMTNGSVSDILKENLVEDALKKILYTDRNIVHVYFVDSKGRYYSSTRAPEKIVNEAVMKKWTENHSKDEKNWTSVIPTHEPDYYRNTEGQVFTFARNIMNTRSLRTANTDILGTLYLDIPTESFDKILKDLRIMDSGQILIADHQNRALIYSNYDNRETQADYVKIVEDGGQNSVIKTNQEYLIRSDIEGTPWSVFVKLPFTVFEKLYYSLIKSAAGLFLISVLLLAVLYYYNSKTISRPIRTLKAGMDQIKAGDLSTRVNVNSKDELGILADGLNNMTEQLQKHIEKVYLSEIRQKEAQLKALTTQIQPHYLYNTLDAIRMSAVMNDDENTALMLESLSHQMRYLLGDNKKLVSLKEELDSINNYFVIVRLRYENQIGLEIAVDDDTLPCMIPRLTLQPLIENSVKYGVIPKEGGTIAIYARRAEGDLELTVIDDGAGMDEETLLHVRNVISGAEKQKETEEKKFSIGLKNVEDRIQLQFGGEYGITIDSTPGLGTLVRCRVPVITGEGEE